MAGLVGAVKPGLSGVSMQAVMTRWSDAYSKSLDVSILSCVDVACLAALKVIEDGRA